MKGDENGNQMELIGQQLLGTEGSVRCCGEDQWRLRLYLFACNFSLPSTPQRSTGHGHGNIFFTQHLGQVRVQLNLQGNKSI